MRAGSFAAAIAVLLLVADCAGPPARPVSPGAVSHRVVSHRAISHRVSGSVAARTPATPDSGAVGVASYYRAGGLSAAHRTLPFGTKVRVTNTSNGRSVVVQINDRGPFIRGRSIDLSHGAAEAVGMTQAGVAQVRMEVVK